MAPSQIATPEVLAAFSRAESESSRKVVRGILSRAFSIREQARLPVFRGLRALVTLFGELAILLDDQHSIQLHEFAILPLHQPIKTITLYDGFLANQDIRGSDAHTIIDPESNISEVLSFANSADRAKRLRLTRPLGATDKEALHPQRSDPYRPEECSDDDCSENCDDWQIVAAEKNIEVEMFPDFMDCMCLSCLGYEVPEILGDHHNTECPCDTCKPSAITGVNHRMPRVKGNAWTRRTKKETKALISYSPLLSPLYPPAALRIVKKTHDSRKEELNNKTGDNMKSSRYSSGTDEAVLDAPRLCEKLAAIRMWIYEQKAELLTPWLVYQGFKRIYQDMESKDGSEDSSRAFALERTTLQNHRQRKSLPADTNEGGALFKEGRDEQAGPQTSLPAAPSTPENQIWHAGEESWKEHNKSMKIAFAVQATSDPMTSESDVDPEAETDPFITVDELMSQSIKMKARRAAFNARLSQKFIDWIDDRVAHRRNNSRSPTPVARVGASEEWRAFYRARLAKVVQVSPGSIRSTQILGLRKTPSSPALSPLPSPHSAGAKEPKRVLAEPVVATFQHPRLCAEIDRPLANFASMRHVAELDDRVNRDFFNRKKKSRFSELFKSLRAVKR